MRDPGATNAMRARLLESPAKFFGTGCVLLREDYRVETGDEIDLVFSLPGGRYVTAVLLAPATADDLRGLLRAVKDRALLSVREGVLDEMVIPFIVAPAIPEELTQRAKRYGVRTLGLGE